jgi:hypothetical protein
VLTAETSDVAMQDGVTRPSALRRAGITAYVLDATDIAIFRMYHGTTELWRGFSHNAS